jgi:hypothetical protein
MENETINILTDAIKEYYGNYELEELCSRFNIEMDYLGVNPNHKKLASKLISQEGDSYRKFLAKILPELFNRCNHRILNSTWESNVFDEQMLRHLKKLQILLAREKKSIAVTAPKNYFFKSKSEPVKFFAGARTAVTIVDTQVGTTTLGCLKEVKHPIRLLTGREEQTLSGGFKDVLKAFCSQGHDVEIRCHVLINDRYLFFNGRCWLASAPLNDTGSKIMSLIECIDAKSAIAKEVERKWREAEIYRV